MKNGWKEVGRKENVEFKGYRHIAYVDIPQKYLNSSFTVVIYQKNSKDKREEKFVIEVDGEKINESDEGLIKIVKGIIPFV